MAACGCRGPLLPSRRAATASLPATRSSAPGLNRLAAATNRPNASPADSSLPPDSHSSSSPPPTTSPSPKPHPRPPKPSAAQPSDLKQKYSSLLQSQVISHVGFNLQQQPPATPDTQQQQQQQQEQQQPGATFVHATPLPSLREDMRIRFKLQTFMTDHARKWPEAAAPRQQQQQSPKQQQQEQEQQDERERREAESLRLAQQQQQRRRRRLFPALQSPLFTTALQAPSIDMDSYGPSTSSAGPRSGRQSSSSLPRANRRLPPPPLPPPMPRPDPGVAPASRSDIPATQLPSMVYPKGRRVPQAVRRRLLRLRSADYDLAARRGFGARLDRLVLEQQRRLRRRREAPAPAPAAPPAPDHASGAAAKPEGAWGQYYPEVEAVDAVVQRLLHSEAGLPSKAFYGRRGEQLSSLSPDAVSAQIGVWLDIAGPDYTLRFLEKEPTLLMRHPGWLLQGLESFNQVLGLDPGQCLQFALKNSALLGMTQEQLQGVVEEVGGLLDLPLPDARRLLIKNTTLATAPGSLAARLEDLATLLPVSRARLSAIVRQRPTLLTQSATRLALALAELSAATGLPLFNASLLAAGQPGLLGLSDAVIRARFRRLQQLAGGYAPWAEQLRNAPPAALGRCLVASDAAIERLAACLAAWTGPSPAGGGAAAAPAVRPPPSAHGLKLHRILSMTDDAFAALLADERRAAAVPGRPAPPPRGASDRTQQQQRRRQEWEQPPFENFDADNDTPPHPSSLRVLGEKPSAAADPSSTGDVEARNKAMVGS